MAWRPTQYVIEGELDNTHPGKVTGWMQFAGLKDKVTCNLEGNFHRDIRGAKIHFHGDASETDVPPDAAQYMKGFSCQQTGKVGDITAGREPVDYVNHPYIEWYSEENGRVVLELESVQVEVIGQPIPALESFPISREKQAQNMAEFLGSITEAAGIPPAHAVCVGSDKVIHATRRTTHTGIRGMKLLPRELRKKLPPLYAQDGKGGKAIAYLKFFTPDSNFTWWITEGSPILDDAGHEVDFQFFGLVEGLCRELGYVNLSQLESVKGPLGLFIERDLHWQPRTLAEITPEMFTEGEVDDEG